MRLLLSLLLLSETVDRESLRFVYSAEQGYDTSCGLTTLACLMDRYWDVPVDESALAEEFLAEKLAEGNLTVSFSDMALILDAKGFVWKAYRMTLEQLEKAAAGYAPLIVHYERPEGHFALVLSARGGELVTADPAEGTVTRGRDYFESRWSGKVIAAVLPGRAVNRTLLDAAEASARGRSALLDRAALAGVGAVGW